MPPSSLNRWPMRSWMRCCSSVSPDGRKRYHLASCSWLAFSTCSIVGNPTRIARTYLGSTTTAFPEVSRSAGRCSSSNRRLRERWGEAERRKSGSRRGNRVWVKCLKMQTNRYARTSFLQVGKMPSKVKFGRRLRWVLPLEAVSLFRG
jgi:hypothetical protein